MKLRCSAPWREGASTDFAMKGMAGDIIETLGEEIEKGSQTALQQVVGQKPGSGQNQVQKKQPSDQSLTQKDSGSSSNDQTKDFLRDVYAPSSKLPTSIEVQQKEEEDKQKVEALRQRLHSEYYQKLTNPPKPQEERPAEKVEREKQQELQELQEQELGKPPPLAAQRAATKVEKFRGVSG